MPAAPSAVARQLPMPGRRDVQGYALTAARPGPSDAPGRAAAAAPRPPSDEHALREPPHALQAEHSVLGALMIDNSAWQLLGGVLEPQHFFVHEHRVVFAVIERLLKAGEPADVVTVWEELQRADQADDVGGLSFLHELAACVPGVANVRRYADMVVERWADRELIAAQDDAAKVAWQLDLPMPERIDRIAGLLTRAKERAKGGGRRVPLLSLEELRTQAQAIRWVVKRVIPSASVGMLFGASGTFKSFIALDAALHVAHGLPWMGRLTKQGPVLYVAAEGGAALWGRIDAWHRARNLPSRKAPLWVVPTAVDLSVDAWRVVDAAQAVGVCPAMVVVDTLSQTYTGEENSANEMAAYLREIGLRFRELWGCTVLLVHHSGHSATERPRGSSAIRSNIDYLMGVCRDEKEMVATVNCVKQKDGELFDDATFHLRVVDTGWDEDGDKTTSLFARHLASDEELGEVLAAEQVAGRGGRTSLLISLLQTGVEEKVLRNAFYDAVGIVDADARKKAYYRARDTAIRQGAMEVVDEAGKKTVLDLRKPKK